MSNEKNLFTVGEDEKITEEIICVAENEIGMDMPIIVSPVPQNMSLKTEEKSDNEEDSTDWRVTKKPKHFLVFLFNEMDRIPKPGAGRGNKSMLEKLLGMYDNLDHNISKAMRSDCDDEIDATKVDEIRNMIGRYKDEVQDALDGIELMTKQKRNMRRRADENNEDLVKEATTPPFKGIQVQMSAFERAIVGAIINGAVSGGRNIEELYKEIKDKYKLSDREELAILAILQDFGYPIFKDRLSVGSKDGDPTEDRVSREWMSNYYA